MVNSRMSLPLKKLLPETVVTVHVTGVRWWRAWLQLGLMFVAIGTWIAGFQLRVDFDGDK